MTVNSFPQREKTDKNGQVPLNRQLFGHGVHLDFKPLELESININQVCRICIPLYFHVYLMLLVIYTILFHFPVLTIMVMLSPLSKIRPMDLKWKRKEYTFVFSF